MKTSLITKLRRTDERTNERTNKNFSSYRDHPLRGDLKIDIIRFVLKPFFIPFVRFTKKIMQHNMTHPPLFITFLGPRGPLRTPSSVRSSVRPFVRSPAPKI